MFNAHKNRYFLDANVRSLQARTVYALLNILCSWFLWPMNWMQFCMKFFVGTAPTVLQLICTS